MSLPTDHVFTRKTLAWPRAPLTTQELQEENKQMSSPTPHTPEEDKTPGRDALALAFYDPAWHEMSPAAMQRMPDEWQGRMAALINEFALHNQEQSQQ